MGVPSVPLVHQGLCLGDPPAGLRFLEPGRSQSGASILQLSLFSNDHVLYRDGANSLKKPNAGLVDTVLGRFSSLCHTIGSDGMSCKRGGGSQLCLLDSLLEGATLGLGCVRTWEKRTGDVVTVIWQDKMKWSGGRSKRTDEKEYN